MGEHPQHPQHASAGEKTHLTISGHSISSTGIDKELMLLSELPVIAGSNELVGQRSPAPAPAPGSVQGLPSRLDDSDAQLATLVLRLQAW